MIARAQLKVPQHRRGLWRYWVPALKREGAIVLCAATSVNVGTVGTPLALAGTLETCRLLSFEERLGNEVIGVRPGIA